MNFIVKALVVFTIFFSPHSSLHAQLKLSPANGIGPDIRKVISDYPQHFKNLTGEIIDEHPQSIDYACNFTVNGAEQTSITQYTSKNNDNRSWQTLMLTTEDFDEAKKKFRSLYSQLNNLSVKPNSSGTYHLKGVYIEPTEERKFTSALLSIPNASEGLDKLRVEVLLQYEMLEWKVRVLVYNKEREDTERGDREEL